MGFVSYVRKCGMPHIELIHEELTRSVIGAFYEVSRILGFGFLEHVYVASLTRELQDRGHQVECEAFVPVFYKGAEVSHQRLNMIVDAKLVVEIKSTRILHEGAVRQLANYLRATDLELGLLLHFGPRSRFYRVICTNPISRTPNNSSPRFPSLPRIPRDPSVSVVSGNESAEC